MPEIHVHEPASCCTTGVCGPELDQDLVHLTADVSHVNEAGGQVARHNLAKPPRSLNLVGSTGQACVPGSDDGAGGGCC